MSSPYRKVYCHAFLIFSVWRNYTIRLRHIPSNLIGLYQNVLNPVKYCQQKSLIFPGDVTNVQRMQFLNVKCHLVSKYGEDISVNFVGRNFIKESQLWIIHEIVLATNILPRQIHQTKKYV